jgi:hypothetical protein
MVTIVMAKKDLAFGWYYIYSAASFNFYNKMFCRMGFCITNSKLFLGLWIMQCFNPMQATK